MEHVGTVTKTSKVANREFHGECSCGTAGDFKTKEDAIIYLSDHGGKVTALGAINTFKLVDNSDKPEVLPTLPATHAPSAAVAAKSPVPPPPPPPPMPATATAKAPEPPKK